MRSSNMSYGIFGLSDFYVSKQMLSIKQVFCKNLSNVSTDSLTEDTS